MCYFDQRPWVRLPALPPFSMQDCVERCCAAVSPSHALGSRYGRRLGWDVTEMSARSNVQRVFGAAVVVRIRTFGTVLDGNGNATAIENTVAMEISDALDRRDECR
jgi:hypothetical protein